MNDNELKKTYKIITEPDGTQTFRCGNTVIPISEHFANHGKPLNTILADTVRYAAGLPPVYKIRNNEFI